MHVVVFYVAVFWMTGLLAFSGFLLIRATTVMTRILALDVMTLILVALLVLYADSTRTPYYLDAALGLALLSFVATVAAVRYHTEGRIF